MSNKFDIFIAVIIPIITLIIGWFLNLFSANITFKKTRELEKNKSLQAKIEELAKLIYKIKQGYTQIGAETRTNKVTITENGVSTGINLKNIGDALKSIGDTFPLLYLLINFYFPELKSEYDELLNKDEDINKLLIPFWLREDEERCREAEEKMSGTVGFILGICDHIISSSTKIAQKLL
jgi:hypothetical protein